MVHPETPALAESIIHAIRDANRSHRDFSPDADRLHHGLSMALADLHLTAGLPLRPALFWHYVGNLDALIELAIAPREGLSGWTSDALQSAIESIAAISIRHVQPRRWSLEPASKDPEHDHESLREVAFDDAARAALENALEETRLSLDPVKLDARFPLGHKPARWEAIDMLRGVIDVRKDANPFVVASLLGQEEGMKALERKLARFPSLRPYDQLARFLVMSFSARQTMPDVQSAAAALADLGRQVATSPAAALAYADSMTLPVGYTNRTLRTSIDADAAYHPTPDLRDIARHLLQVFDTSNPSPAAPRFAKTPARTVNELPPFTLPEPIRAFSRDALQVVSANKAIAALMVGILAVTVLFPRSGDARAVSASAAPATFSPPSQAPAGDQSGVDTSFLDRYPTTGGQLTQAEMDLLKRLPAPKIGDRQVIGPDEFALRMLNGASAQAPAAAASGDLKLDEGMPDFKPAGEAATEKPAAEAKKPDPAPTPADAQK